MDLICVLFGDYFQNVSCARLQGSSNIIKSIHHKGVRCICIEMYSQLSAIGLEKCAQLITRQPVDEYMPSYSVLLDCKVGNEPRLQPYNIQVCKIVFVNQFEISTFRSEWKALEFRDELMQLILASE